MIKPADKIGPFDNVLLLMPKYSDIPSEFKQSTNPYVKKTAQWFLKGIKRAELIAKPGIDAQKAIAHLSEIQSSFEPQHEHKSAAIAYLMSQWFDLT